jgi:hypothetical protein
MFKRKHYYTLIEWLSDLHHEDHHADMSANNVACFLAHKLEQDNPRFKKDPFLRKYEEKCQEKDDEEWYE